jgi:ribosomal protein S18 acetylase RimI-like enzyme
MDARVRPARPADKDPLMSFIKDNWGGHDYIPQVWDGWLEDREGRVFVVEADGVPVGMSRVKLLGDGSAWLEGARVHPGFRGRGLATMLGSSAMRFATARGVKVFRLDSRSTNRSAHRQIARMSFEELSRVNVYEPGERARFAPQEGVRHAEVADLSRVTRLITESREFRLGSGVYWDSYEATSLSPSTIEKLVREGSVWTSGESVAVATLEGARDRAWRQVGFITGTGDGPMRLVRHIFGLRGAAAAARRMVWIPQGSRIIAALKVAGFSRHGTQVLFERTAVSSAR